MKIVIDIPKETYEVVCKMGSSAPLVIVNAFRNGTPLPKDNDVLDKIRAEIEDLTYYWCEIHPRTVIDDVLKIIDKYTAESEEGAEDGKND